MKQPENQSHRRVGSRLQHLLVGAQIVLLIEALTRSSSSWEIVICVLLMLLVWFAPQVFPRHSYGDP